MLSCCCCTEEGFKEETFRTPLLEDGTNPQLNGATPHNPEPEIVDDPVRLLSLLDEERLIAALANEDIRLVRPEWLLNQPDGYRMQRRQDLEIVERSGALPSPLLSGAEAVKLIRNAKREVGVLS